MLAKISENCTDILRLFDYIDKTDRFATAGQILVSCEEFSVATFSIALVRPSCIMISLLSA